MSKENPSFAFLLIWTELTGKNPQTSDNTITNLSLTTKEKFKQFEESQIYQFDWFACLHLWKTLALSSLLVLLNVSIFSLA